VHYFQSTGQPLTSAALQHWIQQRIVNEILKKIKSLALLFKNILEGLGGTLKKLDIF